MYKNELNSPNHSEGYCHVNRKDILLNPIYKEQKKNSK